MSDLKKAINIEKNVMICACAGAGKTYALTKRYINILDTFAMDAERQKIEDWRGPRNILVITFTKKATAEMAGRIYEEVYKLVHDETVDQPEGLEALGSQIKKLAKADKRYIPWLQREFTRSQIMTIDALCHMILLENPVKAGIDPGITTEDEMEVKDLVAAAQRDFIRELSRKMDPDLKVLIDGFGLYNVREYLKTLAEDPVPLETVMKDFELPDEDILRTWKDRYEPKGLPVEETVRYFSTLIRKITSHEFGDNISIPWRKFETLVSGYDGCSESDRLRFYAENIHPVFLTGDKYRKTLPTGNLGNWNAAGLDRKDKKEFDARVKDFLGSLEERMPLALVDRVFNNIDRQSIPLIRSLLKVFSQYAEFLEDRKLREGFLTYKDVIIKTRNLLKSDATLAREYSDRYDHIMVDEFQDTNDLRWDIVRAIASREGQLRKMGLFMVGDEKQSIYRFMNADVTVMNRTQKELKENGNFELIEFSDNYRSSDWLIRNCINPLFKKILQTDRSTKKIYEAEYQKTFFPGGEETVHEEDSFYKIDLMSVRQDKKDEFTGSPLNYPLHVARLVKRLLGKIKFEKGDGPRIGILVRQIKTNSVLFREAFKQEGVELEIIGGRGFWSRQEVMDIEAILSFLVNPFDDVAMITLLRSPIFALDDITLNNILKYDRKNRPIFDMIEGAFPEIVQEMNAWVNRSRTEPIDRLLTRIFNTEHRDLGYLSEIDGKQRWANIHKCIDMIHTWIVKGEGITEIRNRIRDKIQQDDESGEFAIMPSSSDVVLMTIHQAKGLQFPVVVVPDLQRSSRNSSQSGIILERLYDDGGDSRVELGVALKRLTGVDTEKTTLLKALKQQVAEEEFAESKRLLYVAVTRARYGVLLSGCVREGKKGFGEPRELDCKSNFLDWVRGVYGITDGVIKGNSQIDSRVPDISISEFRHKDMKQGRIEEINLEIQEVQSEHPKYNRVRVHDLLGIEPSGKSKSNEKSLKGMSFGSLIHKILEKGWLDFGKYKTEIMGAAMDLGLDDISGNQGELDAYIKRLGQYPLLKRLSDIPAGMKFTEHGVNGLLRSLDGRRVFELSGIIDLLYQDGNAWVVLDYKTDVDREFLPNYKVQVQVYLHLVNYLYHIEVLRGEIFFTEDGTLETVDFDPNFFRQFNFDGSSGWKFQPLDQLPGKLGENFPETNENTIIISPTRRRAGEVRYLLAGQGRLVPGMKILHPGSFMELIDPGRLKLPTQADKRAAARKVFRNKFLEKSFYDYPGLLGSIVSAFDRISEENIKPISAIATQFREYLEKMTEHGFVLDIPSLVKKKADLSLNDLIIDGCISVTGNERELYQSLSEGADNVTYLDLDGKSHSEFNYNLDELKFSIPEIPESDNVYYRPFNMEKELETVAAAIVGRLRSGVDLSSMLIVLTSMEKYLPNLLNIFSRYNIPVTVAKREPVMERPVIQVALQLFNLMQDEDPDWTDVRTLYSHPLGQYLATKDYSAVFEADLWNLDLVMRQGGLRKLLELGVEPSLENTYKIIVSHLAEIRKKGENPGKDFAALLDNNYESQDIMENRAYRALTDAVNLLNRSIERNGLNLPPQAYRSELMEILAPEEIPTAEMDWGIQVVSVPDSANLHRDALFAPGLSQEDFPSLSGGNFLLGEVEDVHDITNRMIFQSWFRNFGHVHMSCPLKDLDGKDQQASFFLEPLGKPKKISEKLYEFLDGNYSRKRNAVGRKVFCSTDDQVLNRQVERHNALLGNPLETKYYGILGSRQKHLVKSPFSATQLDKLANIPLSFLLEYAWNVKETDREDSEPLIRGNLIHEVLQNFAEPAQENGWDLNRRDRVRARERMVKIFDDCLKKKTGALDSDLEVYGNYYPFIHGLKEEEETGLLFRILEEDRKRISEFRFVSAEQGFGLNEGWEPFELDHPELGRISFRGRIDRIDVHDTSKTVTAVDFKTGNVDWKPVGESRSLQLPLYYLVLKREYPEHKILLTYRQVKSFAEYGFSRSWLGDIGENGYSNGITIESGRWTNHVGPDNLEHAVLASLTPIVDGGFKLAADTLALRDASYYYLKAAVRLETVKFLSDESEDG